MTSSSSKRILYGTHMSPAVRAVHMTLEALELDYEFKALDVWAGETRTPEFLKKNPTHTVPTLEEEDGTCIWDSHAIMAYLVRRYGKDDSLYPKGFYERAVVDQRLHHENGNLFMSLGKYTLGGFLRGTATKEQVPEMVKSISEAYEILEIFLGDNKFIAGKTLTIADLSIVSTVSAIATVAPVESEKFPKLSTWYETMKKLPYYDMCNAEGVQLLHDKIQAKLAEMA